MKKIPLLFFQIAIVSASAATLLAQSSSDHTPRDGDRLHPGLSDSRSLLSVNDSSKTVIIDPSIVFFDDDHDASPYIDNDTISYVQFATKHRFLLRGDTLSYIGYENRAAYFRLDPPVAVAVFPLRDGVSVREDWTGHLFQYGTMMLKHVKGESRGETQGGWSLRDGTDTLRNAVRLRWTLDMAYADTDSVSAAMPDSVASEIISDMQVDVKAMLSERLLTERSMWFSESARYPVLTDSRVSRIMFGAGAVSADTVPHSMLAMYYPAAYQYSDTGEEIIARKPNERNRNGSYGEYGPELSETETSLTVGEPTLNGDIISLTLGSMSGTESAIITLFSDSGIRLTEPKEVTVGPVARPFGITVPSGWNGVVLIHIDFRENSYTRKVII